MWPLRSLALHSSYTGGLLSALNENKVQMEGPLFEQMGGGGEGGLENEELLQVLLDRKYLFYMFGVRGGGALNSRGSFIDCHQFKFKADLEVIDLNFVWILLTHKQALQRELNEVPLSCFRMFSGGPPNGADFR